MRIALVPSILALMTTATAEDILDPQSDQLPQITITATKVPSDPVTVPASVAVISGTQIIEAGHTSIDDLAASTAGVHFMSLGTHTTYPVIRGMFGLEVDYPTGYYLDGVAQQGLGADQMVDVERVEIIRGPQGTLYGRNSVPGIVNVVTRDPGAAWSGYGILDGAQNNSFGLTVAGGGPVSNGFGIRLAAHGLRSDSVFENTAPTPTNEAINRDSTLQGKIRWSSKEGNTSATLSEIRNRFYSSGDKFAPVNDALRHRTNNDHTGAFNRQLDSTALTIDQRLSDAILITSITGSNRSNDIFDIDQDFTPINDKTYVRDTYDYNLSQELRVSGGQGLRSWIIGVYGSSGRKNVRQENVMKASFLTKDSDIEKTSRNIAIFGQGGIPLSERLTLTLGLRADLDRETVNATSITRTSLPPAFTPPAISYLVQAGTFTYEDERRFHALLPKASLSWSWTKTAFTYGTLSRGYRSGGYNNTPFTRPDIEGGYEPEYATVYEVGHRATFLDRRISFNVAAYHTDYTDKQVVILDTPRYYFTNIGRVAIDGGEAEFNARPMPGLDIFSSLGIIRSRIVQYGGPLVGATGNALPNLEGNQLAMAPVFDSTIGAQWRHASGLFIRPEIQFVGHYYADNDNNILQDPYQLLSLRIGYEWDQAGIYVWGKNIGEAHYLTRGSTTSFSGNEHLIGVAGEPRSIGGSAQIEF